MKKIISVSLHRNNRKTQPTGVVKKREEKEEKGLSRIGRNSV